MAELELAEQPRGRSDLRIAIYNERPIEAAELGKLLNDLSSDYQRLTGGSLVLARLETGSTILFLTEAALALAAAANVAESTASIASAVEKLATFAKKIKTLIRGAESDPISEVVTRPKAPGVRSVERIIRIAAERRADVEIEYESDAGGVKEKINVRMTPSDAERIQQSVKLHRDEFQETKAIAGPNSRRLGSSAQLALEEAVESFRALPSSVDRADFSQLDPLIATIVSVLKRNNAGYYLPTIVNTLEVEGRFELAAMIRKHIRPEGEKNQITNG